jgi:ribosomal protein L13E
MRRGRWLGTIGVAVAIAGLWAPSAHAQVRRHVKAVTCRDCHPDIYDEWKDSQHAKAWSDPRFQAALKVAEQPETCMPCHAPEPIFAAGVGAYPVTRRFTKSEGVSCVTCHAKGDGYAGPYPAKDMDDVGHYSSQDDAFKSYTLCATCHGQEKEKVHNQVRDYLQTISGKNGKACQECHMPRVVRPAATDTMGKITYRKRPGRHHSFAGSHDAGMRAKAASVEVTVSGRTATVKVTNVEAAHAIPAAADRAVRVEITVTPAGAKPTTTLEVWGWDKRLLEKQHRSATVALPAGAGHVTATLWHCFGIDDPRAEWAKMTTGEARYK